MKSIKKQNKQNLIFVKGMRYCAIMGKHKLLCMQELYLCQPYNIHNDEEKVFFQTKKPEILQQLGGIIKYGHIDQIKKIMQREKKRKIVGVNDKRLGIFLKKNYGRKRFKIIKTDKSDLEIKRNGLELIQIRNGDINEKSEVVIIDYYQDIKRFTTIDFEKPSKGMTIGMMPAKLTQILLNIGISNLQQTQYINTEHKNGKITITDPFCGFGTTGFVANSLNYNFIGLDKNITEAKKNLKRWKKTVYYKNLPFVLIKHDNNKPFSQHILKKTDLILSEGWLGPVVTQKTHKNELKKNEILIFELYKNFFLNLNDFFEKISGIIVVPKYVNFESDLNIKVLNLLKQIGREAKILQQTYKRPNQLIAREICIFNKPKL